MKRIYISYPFRYFGLELGEDLEELIQDFNGELIGSGGSLGLRDLEFEFLNNADALKAEEKILDFLKSEYPHYNKVSVELVSL